MSFQIIMRSVVLVTCLINLAVQKDKRMAYAVASIGWFLALADVAF